MKNQFECPKCKSRKIKFLNRKNTNICSCGAMMRIYYPEDHSIVGNFEDEPHTKFKRALPIYEEYIEMEE